MEAILIAVMVVSGFGLLVGVFLGIADKRLKMQVNEREEAILAALPGSNCGACGHPGCSGLAAAIDRGEAEVTDCPPGGEAAAEKIAALMGTDIKNRVKMTAFIKCDGNKEKAVEYYDYTGVDDCYMLFLLPNGGFKSCSYGCLGLGNCARACPFDAIRIEESVVTVDKEACTACGKCVDTCPKNLITMIPYDATCEVACVSKDKGAITRKACKVGCIGCGLCRKVCESDAIVLENFVAKIDQTKCSGCGACIERCPQGTILRV